MKRAVIFRLDLFKQSEPFIADQAAALQDWEPVFLGRHLFGSKPEWAETVLLSERDKVDRLLGDINTAVFHAHFAVDACAALRYASRRDLAMFVTLHGFDVTRSTLSFVKSGKPNLVRYALMQSKLHRSKAHFLAVSEFIRQTAVARGFPFETTTVHHIGIPTDASSLPLESRSRRIVHVGRLVEKKGTEHLIRAIELLSPTNSDVDLVIVGDGPLRPTLELLVENQGIEQRVRFVGAATHEETLEIIAKSAVLCLPSQRGSDGDAEGLGMVLLEAAKYRVPIVATASGGIVDFIEDEVTGLLAPERSPGALATALDRILQSPQLGQSLAQRAQKRLLESFDVSLQTRLLEEAFAEATCA